MGCRLSKRSRNAAPGYLETVTLASETSFTVNEVEALYVLYKQLSSSIVDDGIIDKEKFQVALLGNNEKKNLILDRIREWIQVYAQFVNQNGVIEFGDFVRSISIFHPKASQTTKIEFVFNLYDLQRTGYIERQQLKDMLLAILDELHLMLSDDLVEAMLDKTFMEVDTKGDGKIDPEEWKEFTSRNPILMKNMTLQCLMEVTTAFPSFIISSRVHDSYLAAGENGQDWFHSHGRVVPNKAKMKDVLY